MEYLLITFEQQKKDKCMDMVTHKTFTEEILCTVWQWAVMVNEYATTMA